MKDFITLVLLFPALSVALAILGSIAVFVRMMIKIVIVLIKSTKEREEYDEKIC